MTVTNLKTFLEARNCGETTKEEISRNTYKYTDCGAWIEFSDSGVRIGSIVEGCDEGTDTYMLIYPFDIKDFWAKLQLIEDEADEIWKSTHGCGDCALNGEINPYCNTCEGEGTII